MFFSARFALYLSRFHINWHFLHLIGILKIEIKQISCGCNFDLTRFHIITLLKRCMPTITAAIIKIKRIFFGIKFINIEFGNTIINMGYKFASLKSACYVLSSVNYRLP